MNIRVEQENDIYVMFLEGRLDTSASAELADAIDDLIFQTSDIIIDMEKVDYITSAGMRVLLKADMEIKKTGQLTLRNINNAIKDIFKMVNFTIIVADDDQEETQDAIVDEKLFFAPHVLSSNEKQNLPPRAQAHLEYEETQCFEIINEDEDILAIAVTSYLESTEVTTVECIQIFSENEDLVFKEMVERIIEYFEKQQVKKFSIIVEKDSPAASQMEKYAIPLRLKNIGVGQISEEYSMSDIIASPLYKQLEQLNQMMKNVKNLNMLTETEMFDLRLLPDVDVERLDPVFCRFFVLDECIVGGLNAMELDDSTIIINYLNVREMTESEHAMIFMLASFISSFSQMMEDNAKLIIDLDDERTIKGIEKVLGQASNKTKYLKFEK